MISALDPAHSLTVHQTPSPPPPPPRPPLLAAAVMSVEQLEDELLIDKPDSGTSSNSDGIVVSSPESAPAPRTRTPAMAAALAKADADAALTDTPAEATSSDDGSSSSSGKDPLLDALSVQLPHLPSPFDSVYPRSRGGDRWHKISPDAHCMLSKLEEGSGPNAPVLHRIYINVVGRLPDGRTFLDFPSEELDFTLGQATVPKGLEMACCQMNAGEHSLVRCTPDYGWSATRRPKDVPADQHLFFSVRVLRWEKEKNLHEMSLDDKYSYAETRRLQGKDRFTEGKPLSAAKQYEKALTALDSIRNHEVSPATVQTKRDLMAMFLVNEAQCFTKLKDYPRVLELTGKALALNPLHMKALFRRAEAHRSRGEFPEALAHYARVENLYVPALNATEEEREKMRAKAAEDESILAAVRAAVKDCAKKQEAAAQAQRRKLGGFLSSAAVSSSAAASPADSAVAGNGAGLGLYDDMPLVSPSASKSREPEDDFEWLNKNAAKAGAGMWESVQQGVAGVVAFFRGLCGQKQNKADTAQAASPTAAKKTQ